MQHEGVLSGREQEILRSIVRAYIETGEPLGSRTLSKLPNFSLSPASIRNVMADLADQGYLAQPHTSAGRIPTEKAFRFFVSTLNTRNAHSGHNARLVAELSEADSVEGCIQRTSRMLTDMTRNVGIAAACPAPNRNWSTSNWWGFPTGAC